MVSEIRDQQREFLKGSLEVIILKWLSLYDELYGYELIQRIHDASDEELRVGEGTLYPLLYRLEDQKLIQSSKKIGPNGKERRYYSLTEEGKRETRARMNDLRGYLDIMGGLLDWKKA